MALFNNLPDIKNRYRRSRDKKTVYIDINISYYREIYNEWDFSPFVNQDLDDDLFEYLEEAVTEIPVKYTINIVFHIRESLKDTDKEIKSIIGYKNYFVFQLRKLNNKWKITIRKMLFFGGVGFLLIFGATVIEVLFRLPALFNFIKEGLFIGGWVLFWEMFSIIFFKFTELRELRKKLIRLRDSEISYEYKRDHTSMDTSTQL